MNEKDETQALIGSENDARATQKVEITEELVQESLKHEKVLKDCVIAFERIQWIGIILIFNYTMRTNIFIFYAKSFDDCPSKNTNAFRNVN